MIRSKVVPALAFCALLLVGWCAVRTEPARETYVLPAGFRGPVLIVFGQADGAPEEHVDARRLYRIPPDGVLRTRFDTRRRGWYTPDFRYASPTGPTIAMGENGMPAPPGGPVLAFAGGSAADEGVPYNESWLIGRSADRPAMEARLDSLRARFLKPGSPPAHPPD